MATATTKISDLIKVRIHKSVNPEVLIDGYDKMHNKIIKELGCKVLQIPFEIKSFVDYKTFVIVKAESVSKLYESYKLESYLEEFDLEEEEWFSAKLIDGVKPAKHYIGWFSKTNKKRGEKTSDELKTKINDLTNVCSVLFSELAQWKSPDFKGTINLSFDIEDILNLGHNASLDAESCFRYGGINDFMKANIALIENSFVLIVTDKDGFSTDRMFGWIEKDKKFIVFANAYGVSSNAKRIEIMKKVCEHFKISANNQVGNNAKYHDFRNQIYNRVFINDNFPIIFKSDNTSDSELKLSFATEYVSNLFLS